MLKPIVICLVLSLSATALLAQQGEPGAQQRRAALRAALQTRAGEAVRPETEPVGARQLSPQEREELRRQLRQQRREALRLPP